MSAMKQLIREPCGCFEQTSSTVYPLTMAQKYFQTHSDVDPELVSFSFFTQHTQIFNNDQCR